MITLKRLNKLALVTVAAGTLGTASTFAVLAYDQDVNPNVIFGSGNANGSFTVDTDNNIELGLRGKLRHNAAGAAENTFNSNGDGTYNFDSGVAPTQAGNTGVWSFEWSINTDLAGTLGRVLADLDFVLGLDFNPTQAISLFTFDPINDGVLWDHSMGTNATGNGAGVEAANAVDYANNIASLNVAQQSWKAAWYIPGYDPTVDGTYNISLTALEKGTSNVLAHTEIQIIQGAGGAAVPDASSTAALLGAGILSLLGFRRFTKRS